MPAASALAAALGTLFVYEVTLRIAAAREAAAWDPTTPLDARVPALPWTIVVYSTFYVYYVIAALAAPRTARGAREALRLAQAMLLVALASGTCFVLLPAHVGIRAEMEALRPSMSAWLGALYDGLYALDAPWNAAPSLHVSHSLLPWLATRAWLRRAARPRARRSVFEALGWLAWAAICASILTTRQHFVVDLVSGAAVGALAWVLYVRPAFDEPAAQKAQDSDV